MKDNNPKKNRKNLDSEVKYTISGNGVVHVRASELRKSKKVRETALRILNNRELISQN